MKKLFYLTIMAALFASCVKDRNQLECPTDDRQVAFTTGAQNARAAAGHPVQNITGVIDAGMIPDGSSFGVYAWDKDNSNPLDNFNDLQNIKVTRTVVSGADTYPYNPVAFWPLDPTATMYFMAYYPYQSAAQQATGPIKVTRGNNSNVNMLIDYTVSTNSDEHLDLMYARTNLLPGYDPVQLVFGHALSRLMFQGRMENFPTGADVKITDIKITGAVLKGQLEVLDPTTWPIKPVWTLSTSPGDRGDVTMPTTHLSGVQLTGLLQSVMKAEGTGGINGDILMLPQELNGITIEVTADWNKGGGTITKLQHSFKLDGMNDWLMNEIYVYEITVSPDGISFEVTVIDWGGAHHVNVDNPPAKPVQPGISVDRQWLIANGSVETLNITSDVDWVAYIKPGTNAVTAGNPAKYDEALLSAFNGGNIYDNWVNGVQPTATLTIKTVDYLSPYFDIEGTFTIVFRDLWTGKIIKEHDIFVTSNPPPPPHGTWGSVPWVGTFHRANEKGERIIYSGHTGAWKATVTTGTEWIRLDEGGGPGILTRLDDMYVKNIPGNPESYLVTGNETTVTGTGDILFRVGLTGTRPAPLITPRYGTITLTHSGGTSTIYVRQGEEPDYAPGKITGVKWSPYNLGDYNNRSLYGNGGFTDYPTKAGYTYKYSYATATPTAFHPVNPFTVSGWGSYDGSIVTNVCPSDYMVPPGGSAGMYVASGMTTATSVWGYYADGWFDRRQIVPAYITTGDAVSYDGSNPAASVNTHVAYRGRVFFNTTTGASLFFPASGTRNAIGGLVQTGTEVSYWTSTLNNSGLGGDLFSFTSTSVIPTWLSTGYNGMGFPVRCVSCEPISGVTLSSSAPSANLGSTVVLTATVNPAGTTGLSYIWEYYDGSNWQSIGTTSTNTFNAPIMGIGSLQYRVTAIGCNSLSATANVTGTNPTSPEPDPNILMYVGAFWRSNQTGERIIKMDVGAVGLGNSGTWTASVSWMDSRWVTTNGDGIVLAAGGSPDPNINTSNPGNAENPLYAVPGNATFISGNAPANGSIVFRIGLKTQFTTGYDANTPNYTTTFPARYAIVLLSYGEGKSRRIFIRQGEGADYVMRQEDAINSGGMTGSGSNARPQARRFSPYNIEDVQHRIPAGTQSQYVYFSNVNRGVWVAYPTMIGYLFSFNYSYFGFPPLNGTTGIQPITSSWNGTATWDSNGPETCPTGYRWPNDGSTSTTPAAATVVGSEIRQSLWLNPQSGQVSTSNNDNSVGGIYADGYYDRGVIDLSGSAISSAGKYTVYWNYYTGSYPASDLRIYSASSGRLFYNPNTNASLFLPASGSSEATNGLTVSLVGEFGGYWSTARYVNQQGQNIGAGSRLHFSIWDGGGQSIEVRMSTAPGANHMPVRCVRIP